MFSETEKVNSVPFSPEVEEDRMIFLLFFLSLCVFCFNTVYTLSDYRMMMMMFAIFTRRWREMMEKSDGLKQFTRGDL